MQVGAFFEILPLAVCLTWAAIHAMAASRTSSFVLVFLSLINMGVFLFAGHTALALASAPSVIPLTWLYFEKIRTEAPTKWIQLIWIVAPASLLTAGLIFENINLHLPVDDQIATLRLIYRIVLIAEVVLITVYAIWLVVAKGYKPFSRLIRHFSKGEPITLVEMQFCVAFLMIPPFVTKTLPYWEEPEMISSFILTLGTFLWAYLALFGTKEVISRGEAHRIVRYNYNKDNKGPIVEAMIGDLLQDAEHEALVRIQEQIGQNLGVEEWEKEGEDASDTLRSHIFSAVASTWDDDSLLSRFQQLMLNEQLFLKQGLSLSDVADRLGTNKTYVSKLVNQTYNLGFPELLNTLRVDYAEQYLLSHRNARQAEVAKACGFVSASSFNNTFRKITGMTPKLWVASHSANQ